MFVDVVNENRLSSILVSFLFQSLDLADIGKYIIFKDKIDRHLRNWYYKDILSLFNKHINDIKEIF